MSTKIKIIIAFFAILPVSNIALATDYNYLPADVLIKQQQEKSALEYRLNQLEAQVNGGNPSIQINNINYRIQELENELETEKNYVSGLYGSYGIANQLSSKLAEIEAKYAGQISQLESQKEYYQNQIDEQEKIDSEIEKINKQLKEIDAYYDSQRDIITEQYNQKIQNIKNTPEPTYQEAYAEFLRIDSFETLEQSSAEWQKINSYNPKLAEMVKNIYNNTYPNGKDEDTVDNSQKTNTKPISKDITSGSNKPYEALGEVSSSTSSENIPYEKVDNVSNEVSKESFIQKTFNFFKKLMFWKK